MPTDIQFTLNGQATSVRVDPERMLLDVLRDTLGLKASRLGCGLGQCGACTVILGDHAVTACDTPMWSVAGKSVTTLEGLGSRAAPHPLQTAFIEEQALQCGFCTSGMLMRAAALIKRNPHPSEADIRQALEGNLCRCGVHNRVVRAVAKAVA
ncbi:(2Fe-2S)-binding protein [Ramlibacter sp.]|uniref:(2Fe-2S)-binding protein n=1 Tax=Ramlibacter sp. TaxID=1917967 RepID=UPI002C25A202|nr:(2Fe-2S)-binding protein [Ramlibacter sp.]HWI84334.1 (2Fe-2S)-binding protein [Ramlibacter sp.]